MRSVIIAVIASVLGASVVLSLGPSPVLAEAGTCTQGPTGVYNCSIHLDDGDTLNINQGLRHCTGTVSSDVSDTDATIIVDAGGNCILNVEGAGCEDQLYITWGQVRAYPAGPGGGVRFVSAALTASAVCTSSVGGIGELPDVKAAPEQSAPSGNNFARFAIGGALAAALVAIGAVRFLRRRRATR